jgi:altronate hydrolase
MQSILQIHDSDTVAVALQNLHTGDQAQLNGHSFFLPADIAQKQKIVLKNTRPGEPVIMYGVPVGKALHPLTIGQQLRKADIEHLSAPFSSDKKTAYHWQMPHHQHLNASTFNGYIRSNGQAGTRNYWLVVPLVFCENRNIQTIQQAFARTLGYANTSVYEQRVQQLIAHQLAGNTPDSFVFKPVHQQEQRLFKQVDGIKFLTHEMGCGGSREDAKTLCRLLAGYINHPNVGGATVLSLGCQNATVEWLKEALSHINPHFDKPLYILDQQQTGTNDDLLNLAIDKTIGGLVQINECKRVPHPISKLVLGLKCGASDGFSGISANPALGCASDLLIAAGGSSILAEFPELCGVEQELINRCTDRNNARKFETLMRNYAALSESFGNPFHNNPSEGNIKDGLLTDAMKSAGAARKGGTAPISGVLDYAEQITTPGLQLLCTPGNDVEATTGIAGSGATITVFTTGLGTPTGNPVSPMVKISTNSTLCKRMPDVIDFDCGAIITGTQTIEQCGEALLEKIIQTANGELTHAERLQQDDFIPWRKSISV